MPGCPNCVLPVALITTQQSCLPPSPGNVRCGDIFWANPGSSTQITLEDDLSSFCFKLPSLTCLVFCKLKITALKIKYNPFAKAFLDAKERWVHLLFLWSSSFLLLIWLKLWHHIWKINYIPDSCFCCLKSRATPIILLGRLYNYYNRCWSGWTCSWGSWHLSLSTQKAWNEMVWASPVVLHPTYVHYSVLALQWIL